MFVVRSSAGKGPYLYRHELIGLHNRHLHKFSLPMNKIPEKFLPRKYAITTKVRFTDQFRQTVESFFKLSSLPIFFF